MVAVLSGTATSRGGSIRWSERATSRRRRSWSPTRWRATSTSTSRANPSATSPDGTPVSLRDLWPSPEEVARGDRGVGLGRAVRARVRADLRRRRPVARPPHARGSGVRVGSELDLRAGAAVLRGPRPDAGRTRGHRRRAVPRQGGDSITTDHISPAGSIKPDSPAGRYLLDHGVEQRDFNSYGARRGNHEVMMRGTFANIRLRNDLVPDRRVRGPPTCPTAS